MLSMPGFGYARSRRTWLNIPWMYHVDTMFKCNANDIIDREVRSDGRETLSDLVRFVGLRAGRVRTTISGFGQMVTLTFWRCALMRSSYEKIATVCIASSWAVRKTRIAIS